MVKKQKFLRTNVNKYSKLGVRRKKKQKYRKAKGLDNKIRLKMKGHLRNVMIGFRSEKSKRDLVNELKPVKISNLHDLKNLKKGEIGILSKIGIKKKIEIAEYALKNKLKLFNINSKKFLEKTKEKIEKAKQEKEEKKLKKKIRDKKSKKEAEKKVKEKEEKPEDEKKEEKEKESEDSETPKNAEDENKESKEDKK